MSTYERTVWTAVVEGPGVDTLVTVHTHRADAISVLVPEIDDAATLAAAEGRQGEDLLEWCFGDRVDEPDGAVRWGDGKLSATVTPHVVALPSLAAAIFDEEQRCNAAIRHDPTSVHLNSRLLGLQRARDIAAAMEKATR